jgi:transposase InsO family protein
MKYAFVDAQKAEFSIVDLCRVCEVSRAGYYDWRTRRAAGPSDAEQAEATLVGHIARVHRRSRGAYGEPRVTAQLAREGIAVNHKRVERLMRRHDIAGRCGRRRVRTTIRDRHARPAADLVERDFARDQLNMLWIGDVTYIPTAEGWLFLSTVIDACSRRLLGWSLAEHLRAELCLDALDAAVGLRGGRAVIDGVTFHSDHGTQYTCDAYRQACMNLGIVQSMGSVGDSYDNSMAESFFASLKRELVDWSYFSTRNEARTAIFEWLAWYNGERLHTSLEMRPPVEFEQHLTNHLLVA